MFFWGVFMQATRVFCVAAFLLVVPRLAAAGDPAPAAAAEPAAASGQALYQQYCSACHGMDAKGDGPVAAALKKKPMDLTRIAARRGGTFPAAAILEMVDGRNVAIAHGSREMPVWGRRFGEALTPGTAAETVRHGTAQLIVDYLASIQVEAGAPAKK
jgi:mono/diheme cytochrome c family protein